MSKQRNKSYGENLNHLKYFYVQRIFAGERKCHDAVRNLLKAHGAVA